VPVRWWCSELLGAAAGSDGLRRRWSEAVPTGWWRAGGGHRPCNRWAREPYAALAADPGGRGAAGAARRVVDEPAGRAARGAAGPGPEYGTAMLFARPATRRCATRRCRAEVPAGGGTGRRRCGVRLGDLIGAAELRTVLAVLRGTRRRGGLRVLSPGWC
jgi:hypothetical protein